MHNIIQCMCVNLVNFACVTYRGKMLKDVTQSLNVACLKRMLPIGLTLFGGREQELVQHVKQKLLEVRWLTHNCSRILIVYNLQMSS